MYLLIRVAIRSCTEANCLGHTLQSIRCAWVLATRRLVTAIDAHSCSVKGHLDRTLVPLTTDATRNTIHRQSRKRVSTDDMTVCTSARVDARSQKPRYSSTPSHMVAASVKKLWQRSRRAHVLGCASLQTYSNTAESAVCDNTSYAVKKRHI